jgi:hypothetical protein
MIGIYFPSGFIGNTAVSTVGYAVVAVLSDLKASVKDFRKKS